MLPAAAQVRLSKERKNEKGLQGTKCVVSNSFFLKSGPGLGATCYVIGAATVWAGKGY